jgi:putative pyruvate formate lyase activating enzyme
MSDPPRRKFIKTCMRLALAGLGPAALPGTGGCRVSGERDSAAGAAEGAQPGFEPVYLDLHRSGELKRRGDELWSIMESCRLCPRQCGVNRLAGDEGFCRSSSQLEISSYQPHFGEEKPLVGKGGSGTIFLANCGLRCVFCINWEISQGGRGTAKAVEDMAAMMLKLQGMGCANINFVTPTHYSAHILLAVDMAAGRGLRLPLVYNTCGWERLDILETLDGVIDIYLPDYKYSSGKMAAKYSSTAESYPEITQAALLEMHRQVGVAHPAQDGLMYRGLMIRHLVMPNRIGGTREVLEWIAEHLPKDTYVNVMSQYTPTYKAFDYPEISRRITREEYDEAVRWARGAGLTNLDIQGYPLWG